ncbi:MAG: signal peptidase I [Ruminococcaceae bacterium]|nr:signal peptidase I [Oscillospiraceae bacterium]
MRKIDLDEYDVDIYDENFGLDEEEVTKVEPNKSSFVTNVYEWTHSIIVAVVIVVLLLTFVFRLINIKGTSMENTLLDSDKVIITNFMYEPAVGDIVVIPEDNKYHNEPIIKRIIALEGQEVYINYSTREVYVDGILLEEDYISSDTINNANTDKELSLTVGDGEVFVLGDNRSVSLDSRAFGCVKVEDIIGKAQFVVFPFSNFGYLY